MIPARGFSGATVGVLGMGRTGVSAARALAAGGARAVCWDDSPAVRAESGTQSLELRDLTRQGALSDLSALVVSPGIPHLYPVPHPVIAAAQAAGLPIDNDIGLFFRSLGSEEWGRHQTVPRVIAITGSNGKSTTAALIHHLLTETGRNAQLAGNIGRGVLDIEPPEDGGVVVLELSSYQTELARALTPDVAVFTNLTPDHLNRHGGLGGYFAAKRRLFAEGGPDRAVVGVDEAEGRFLAGQLAEGPADDRVIRISSHQKLDGPGWAVFARNGFLSEYRKSRQVASVDLRDCQGLPGAHNHQNACAAFAACRALGLNPKAIGEALHTFKGLPHRSQVIAERDGVHFVNDSKATNPESAAQALRAFKRVRWIVGGQVKEGGLGTLVLGAETVVKAYVIGRHAAETALMLGDLPNEVCGTMSKAVNSAAAEAVAGDTVLLAPAAASFDQYDNFECRGEDFAAEVAKALDN